MHIKNNPYPNASRNQMLYILKGHQNSPSLLCTKAHGGGVLKFKAVCGRLTKPYTSTVAVQSTELKLLLKRQRVACRLMFTLVQELSLEASEFPAASLP